MVFYDFLSSLSLLQCETQQKYIKNRIQIKSSKKKKVEKQPFFHWYYTATDKPDVPPFSYINSTQVQFVELLKQNFTYWIDSE